MEAAKGFTLGLADAGRGIFEEPYLGAQKEGGKGFLKGAAKGVAGMYAKGGGGMSSVGTALISSGVCCTSEDYARILDGVSETFIFWAGGRYFGTTEEGGD